MPNLIQIAELSPPISKLNEFNRKLRSSVSSRMLYELGQATFSIIIA